MNAFRRLARALGRYGARETIQRGWSLLHTRAALARDRLLLVEHHVWYELDPRRSRPRPELAKGLSLQPGGTADLHWLLELDTVSPADGLGRLLTGNELWLVLDGDQVLFSCWIFRERTPAIAAPGGELRLPPGMVCLEDSVTAPAARGRGIAPAAWVAIFDHLEAGGVEQVITKVETANLPSRRAVAKAGFAEVAVMHFRRIAGISRTSVDVLDGERGSIFRERLEGR